MQKTFKSLIDLSLRQFPKNILFLDIDDEFRLNYTETHKLLQNVIKKLNKRSVNKGDFIVSFSPLNLESVILCWACLLEGFVFVPIDHNWTSILIKQVIDETSPKLVFAHKEGFSIIESIIPDERILKMEDLLNKDHDNGELKHIERTNPQDLAIILYTSGSTGVPKGVMHTQEALYNSSQIFSKYFEWKESDVFLNLGDLHSMSGLRNTCLTPLHTGTSVIIAGNERTNVLKLIQIVDNFNVNYIGIAPTIIRQLNIIHSSTRKQALKSLKAILCTGGMLPKDQLNEFYNKYEIPVLNYYGLTETCGFCSGHNVNTFKPDDNSIGYPVGAEFFVTEDNQNQGEETIGELVVKSKNLMKGYFKRVEETNDVLKGNYFYTGDIVRKRKDGCFELIGRKKNIIKNIYSELIHLEEIEYVLEKHPFIKEAFTCSYSNFEEDEKIVAFIVFEEIKINLNIDTYKEIKEFMVKNVGKHRVPWRYYIEKNLPKGSMGKVQRHLLKEKINEYIQSRHKAYF